MSDAMIFYVVLAISLLAVWNFFPVLFALLDAASELFTATTVARDARSRPTGAPVPLADDMETFRMEAAPSEIGTTRVVPKPVQPSIRLALTASRDTSARKMMQRDG